jgi:hypothetical protein
MKKVILRTPTRIKSNSFSGALFRTLNLILLEKENERSHNRWQQRDEEL